MLPQKTIVKPRRDKTPDEALAALMRLTARAEKCEADALRLMRGWGVAPEEAQRVLARLVRDRFIDNARYTTIFVREKLNLSGWGAYKIRTALKRKQISDELIETALKEQADPEKMADRLNSQLQRKARTVKAKTPYDRRTKLIRYGLSLGYTYDMVMEAVGRLTPETEPLCDDF